MARPLYFPGLPVGGGSRTHYLPNDGSSPCYSAVGGLLLAGPDVLPVLAWQAISSESAENVQIAQPGYEIDKPATELENSAPCGLCASRELAPHAKLAMQEPPEMTSHAQAPIQANS